MNWINIHTETLRGEEFIGAEPLERATWLNLLGWCCAQENDGIIQDCKSWGNRKWQQLCGITKDEVDLNSDLYRYEGDDLVVNFYPIEQQAAVKAKREAGKKGGRPRKLKTSEPLIHKEQKPHGLSDLKDTLNVKESKGKESKGKVIVKKTPQAPKGDIVLTQDQQAELIWAEYPRKLGKAKALTAIKRALKTIDLDDMIKTVKAYAESRKGSDPQFTPHGSSWFGGKKYLDDPKEWDKPTNGAEKTFQSGPIEIAGRKGYIHTREEVEAFYGDKGELPLQHEQ